MIWSLLLGLERSDAKTNFSFVCLYPNEKSQTQLRSLKKCAWFPGLAQHCLELLLLPSSEELGVMLCFPCVQFILYSCG